MAIFYRQSLPWESLNNPKMTWILRAAVNLLCALPRLFYPPHWFVKPPPRFSVWDSGYANRSGPFVCTVCRMARAFCAVPCRFRPPHSFAKAPHQFPVCDYGNANRSRPYVFLDVRCGCFFLLLVEELLYERRNEVITFVTFRVVRIASRLSDVPMDGPPARRKTMPYLLFRSYTLSQPVASTRPLYDILEILKPLWPQSANKTVEDWPTKFSALLEKLQQHGFYPLMPDETNLFNK